MIAFAFHFHLDEHPSTCALTNSCHAEGTDAPEAAPELHEFPALVQVEIWGLAALCGEPPGQLEPHHNRDQGRGLVCAQIWPPDRIKTFGCTCGVACATSQFRVIQAHCAVAET